MLCFSSGKGGVLQDEALHVVIHPFRALGATVWIVCYDVKLLKMVPSGTIRARV